jgi:hypothetical protein
MEFRMHKVGYFFNGCIEAFYREHEPDRQNLEHPFGGRDVKIKPRDRDQDANRKLHHDAVFGRNQLDCALECEAHTFEPSRKKSIVFFEIHITVRPKPCHSWVRRQFQEQVPYTSRFHFDQSPLWHAHAGFRICRW